MSEQTAIECTSACTITLQHEFVVPILNLSMHDGGVIAGAIFSVWAAAFAVRVIARLILDSRADTSEKD